MKIPINEIIVDEELSFAEDVIFEVMKSIRNVGLLIPIKVEEGSEGNYHLIAGQMRLIAAKRVGLQDVEIEIVNTEK